MAADQQTNKKTEVDKWNGQKVKFAVDDAVKEAVNALGYSEQTTYVDAKLFVSFLAVAIAGVCLAYSYMVDFETSKPVMAVCVATYFVLTGVVQAATWLYEGNIIMWAVRSAKETKSKSKYPAKLVVSSHMQRHSSDYTLSVKANEAQCSSTTFSFGQVVDSKGMVHQERVMEMVEKVLGLLPQGDEKKTK